MQAESESSEIVSSEKAAVEARIFFEIVFLKMNIIIPLYLLVFFKFVI